VLEPGDVVSISGPRALLVEKVDGRVPEVDDKGLLDMPATLVDVFVRSRAVNGKTLPEIADLPETRGIYLRKLTRSMGRDPDPAGDRGSCAGDIMTIVGSGVARECSTAASASPTGRSSPRICRSLRRVFVIGGWSGAINYVAVGWPISLSTSGGALLAGLVLGYLRTIHPTFGNIPARALAHEHAGLNVFIAIVGISAGPGFVSGLQQVGMSLFLWGMVATTIPLLVAVLSATTSSSSTRHPFGVCAGVRTTTAALGMIQEEAKSKVPALGYACLTRSAIRC